MRKISYLIFTLIVALLVPFIFRWIQPRGVAALVAGTLFLMVAAAGLWSRRKSRGLAAWLERLTQGVFLFIFALPIIAMRIMNWEKPFGDLSWWGQESYFWHQTSSKVYTVMFLVGVAAHLSELIQRKMNRQQVR